MEENNEHPVYSASDLGISLATSLSKEVVTVGDTLEYTVSVSWESDHVLALLPQNSVVAKGVEALGMSQQSLRSVHDGKTVSKNEFVYKLVASDTGDVTLPTLNFLVPVEGAPAIGLRTEPKTFHVDAPMNMIPFATGFTVAVAVIAMALLRMKRGAAAKARVEAKKSFDKALLEKMMFLKQRARAADSRAWLLDLENVCREYAAEKLGVDVASVNLEELEKGGELPGWKELVELFGEARYGGGNRDHLANLETWKETFKLMNLEEE